MIIFYRSSFTLRVNAHGMLSKGLEPVFHGAEGKGTSESSGELFCDAGDHDLFPAAR